MITAFITFIGMIASFAAGFLAGYLWRTVKYHIGSKD